MILLLLPVLTSSLDPTPVVRHAFTPPLSFRRDVTLILLILLWRKLALATCGKTERESRPQGELFLAKVRESLPQGGIFR
jgi:hypothetical protein